MTHDPLCPMWSKVWAGDVCDCDLIAKARQDERERAGIEQTAPSHEYPFTTVVTVEAAMTDMNRFKWTSFGPLLDEDGPFVLHADAEAAIVRLAATAVEQILGSDEDMRAAITKAFLEDQRDMLAKCIAELNGLMADMANWSSEETNAVTDVVPDLTVDQWLWAQRGVGRSLQVLRALQDKP